MIEDDDPVFPETFVEGLESPSATLRGVRHYMCQRCSCQDQVVAAEIVTSEECQGTIYCVNVWCERCGQLHNTEIRVLP